MSGPRWWRRVLATLVALSTNCTATASNWASSAAKQWSAHRLCYSDLTVSIGHRTMLVCSVAIVSINKSSAIAHIASHCFISRIIAFDLSLTHSFSVAYSLRILQQIIYIAENTENVCILFFFFIFSLSCVHTCISMLCIIYRVFGE